MDSLHLSDLDDSISESKHDKASEMMKHREIEENDFDAEYLTTNHQISEILADVNFLCAKAHIYAKNSGLADDKFEKKASTPKPIKILKQPGSPQSSFFSSTPKKATRRVIL